VSKQVSKQAMAPHYSGPKSRAFWRRVNALKGKDWRAAYTIGVMLQNMEHSALSFLEEVGR